MNSFIRAHRLSGIFVLVAVLWAQHIKSRDQILENLRDIASKDQTRVVYVIVALCDNRFQNIVPVAERFGNGDNPEHNLYWGASYGVKQFFIKNTQWHFVSSMMPDSCAIIERCVFKHLSDNVYLVADAYRGRYIKTALFRFLNVIAGQYNEDISYMPDTKDIVLNIGNAQLVVYVGHNGLMDFELESIPYPVSGCDPRDVMIIACASKPYFYEMIQNMNAYPLLWTEGLCAPEAYVLAAGIKGWLSFEDTEQISYRAASAYSSYQKCTVRAAQSIFVGGW